MMRSADAAALAIGHMLVALVVALCVLAVVVALDRRRLRRDTERRLARFEPPAAETPAAPGAPAERPRDLLKRLGDWTGQQLGPSVRQRQQRLLMRAGLQGELTMDELLGLRTLCIGLGVVAGALLGASFGPIALVAAVAGGVLGVAAPRLVLDRLAERRRQAVGEALPNTLDILVVSLEAGLAFDTSVAYICERLNNPVTAELRLFMADLHVGRSRREALARMVERTPSDEIRRFSNEVLQADLLGVGLTRALQAQVSLLRTERRQRVESLSRQVPVKLMLPTVLFILPVLFIVLLGPALIGILQVFWEVS